MPLKECLKDIAEQKGVSAAQLALAWLLAQRPFIVPIPGTSNMERMEENVRASEITFTDDELRNINDTLGTITIVGERYDPNSENGQSVRK